MEILNKFQDYLISNGYSELTPKGKPSTAHDYSKSRIPKICERENITIDVLAHKISFYIDKYDTFGDESDFGNKSNRAFINALKRFKEFVES